MASAREVLADDPALLGKIIQLTSAEARAEVLLELAARIVFQPSCWKTILRNIGSEPTMQAKALAFLKAIVVNNVDTHTFFAALREASQISRAEELKAVAAYLSTRTSPGGREAPARPVRFPGEKLLIDFLDVHSSIKNKIVQTLIKKEGETHCWELLALELRPMGFQQKLTDEVLDRVRSLHSSPQDQVLEFLDQFCSFVHSTIPIFCGALALIGDLALANQIRTEAGYSPLSEQAFAEIWAARKNPQETGRGAPSTVLPMDRP